MSDVYLISLAAIVVVACAISFSVSYKRKKEQALEQARTNLTNAVAHELKTPLGIIRNHGEAISAGVNPEKTEEYVDVIVKETERLDKLVLDMLDISRLDADAYKIKIERFSLYDLTVSILERFAPLVNVKKLNVKLDAQSDFIISADKNAVMQVIANFMSNAVKYTPENGSIIIKIEKKNGKTFFLIENEGEHIPEDKIDSIWDVFYKTDESRERKDNSTGIGLAIAKKYLQLHKATFGCENYKNGVRFWFEI
jgi:signal transduction histidine kinase